MKAQVALLLGCCLVAGSASAATLNVPADQPSIQAAIAAASDGDTVLVAPGTYQEQIDFLGKAITVKSSGGSATTILYGSGGVPIVTFHSGEGNASVLQGFTLTHAYSTGPGTAAVSISSASPTIEDDVFTANSDGSGTGSCIYGSNSSAVIVRDLFSHDTGAAGLPGGWTVVLTGASPMVADDVFANNSSSGLSLTVLQDGGTPQVNSNTFVGNVTGFRAGDTETFPVATTFVNNIIAFNQVGLDNEEVESYPQAMFNNILYGNTTADYQYAGASLDPSGDTWIVGYEVNPALRDWANGDFHLTSGSIAIEGGDSSVDEPSATDFYEQPRTGLFGTLDIGAAQYQHAAAVDGALAAIEGLMQTKKLGVSGADPGEPLTFAIVDLPTHGTLTLTDPGTGTVQYTPDPGYLGPDSFTFTVTDPYLVTSDPATEQVTVRGPTTLNVPADYPTIQAAVEAAASSGGDTVQVAPGTYQGQIDFEGKDISLVSSGGAAATILDGGGKAPLVTFDSGETGSSVLRGFTLTHTENSAATAPSLSAIYISNASPTIEDDVFTDTLDDNGFDPALGGSDPHSPFYFLQQATGSAIYGNNSSAVVIRNTFMHNGDNAGWVVSFNGASPVVADNVFTNNQAGALIIQINDASSAVQVYNNTMVGNHIGLYVYNRGSTDLSANVFDNDLIAFNQRGLVLFDVVDYGGPLPQIDDDLIYGSTVYDYLPEGDFGGDPADPTTLQGDISADPQLKDWANGDVHLLFASPAIDAGDGTLSQPSATDIYGAPRVSAGRPNVAAAVDIGAAEYVLPTVAAVDGHLTVVEDVAKTGTLASSISDPTEPLNFALATPPAHGTVDVTDAATGAFQYTPEQGFIGKLSFTFSVTDPFGGVTTATETVTVRPTSAITVDVPADYGTIQSAIVDALDGDTILVAPGTYYEKLDFLGKAVTLKSTSGAATTILDGNNGGPIVSFEAGEGKASVLQGFTLTHASDGAILLDGASPTIEDDVFTANTDASGSGGAISGSTSSAVIIRNYFSANSGSDGEGTYSVIDMDGGSSVIADNVFADNPVVACYIQLTPGDAPQVYNNTLVGNAWGVLVPETVFAFGESAAMTVSNNIIAFNQNGVREQSEFISFTNNLVYGNTTANYVGSPDLTNMAGNISTDPRLKDWQHGDFHLLLVIPFTFGPIDAGDASVDQVSSTDFYGAPRVVGAFVDIGAVEHQEITGATGSMKIQIDGVADGALGASASDPGDTFVFSTTRLPEHGTVTITDAATGAFHYVPAAGYHGEDDFAFLVTDPYGARSGGEEDITVDTASVANAGSVHAVADTGVTGKLSATLAYAGQATSFSIVSKPAHGAISVAAGTGQFRYTPLGGFVGNDSFTFQVTDAFGSVSNTATVSTTVSDVAPKVEASKLRANPGRSTSGTLAATKAYTGQVLTFSVVSPPAHGVVNITNPKTGAYTYTPVRGFNGTDSFTFQAIDKWGTASNTAVVKVTVL